MKHRELIILIVFSILTFAYFSFDYLGRLTADPFRPVIRGSDQSFYYFWLRSPLVGGDFDFSDDLIECNTLPMEIRDFFLQQEKTDLGLVANKYGIGWAISSLPWYLLADLYVVMNQEPGIDYERDGFSPPYQFTIFIGQYLYAFLGLIASYLLARSWFSRAASLFGVFGIWIISFLPYYQIIDVSMSHNLVFSCLAGSWLLTRKIELGQSGYMIWVALGVLTGLAVLARYQAVIMLIYPFGIALKELLTFERKKLLGISLCVLSGLILIILQMLAWLAVYGKPILYTYTNEGFDFLEPEILNILFSPLHGLFYWHPGLLFGLIFCLFMLYKMRHAAFIMMVASLLITVYINASWYCWWFGASFGSRAFEGALIVMMLGLAWGFEQLKQNKYAKYCLELVVLCLGFWNVGLMFFVRKGVLPLEEPVSWIEMLDLFLSHLTTEF
ncbi:MAG: hypothetical protein AAGA18_09435 [Verrucomicrobiota bacterium]